jgi:hypothetical protein
LLILERDRGEKMHNPLFDIWQKREAKTQGERFGSFYLPTIGDWNLRSASVKNFSWAVPNEEAIRRIASFSPIIEIGAGSGYWSRMLNQAGAKITAFDRCGQKTKHNPFVYKIHGKVKRGSWKKLGKRQFANHALMLCWPPYNDPMAYNCLKAFKGSTLIMVGESYGGCTGDSSFWELLEKDFEQIDSVDIPTWSGIHDYVMVYKRLKNSG